jgi:hypothetical protein
LPKTKDNAGKAEAYLERAKLKQVFFGIIFLDSGLMG